MADEWEAADRLALLGIGVEPGLSDVFARYAADHLFSHIEELGTRDGSNLAYRPDGTEGFAPGFSMWDDHRGCPNPPVVWEKARAEAGGGIGAGFFTLPPFSEPEVFGLPRRDRTGGVQVEVEHEEVPSCRVGSMRSGSPSSTAWASR